MERIVMKVKPGIADKWRGASKRVKKQAIDAVEQILSTSDESRNIVGEPSFPMLSEEDLDFYDNIQIDLSDYCFDRDEANER